MNSDVDVQIDSSGLSKPDLGAGSPEIIARTDLVTERTEAAQSSRKIAR